jgi:hypothetical protein
MPGRDATTQFDVVISQRFLHSIFVSFSSSELRILVVPSASKPM